MPDKYIIQRRTASGLETVVEVPALESGKIDLSWLPVVGSMGSAIIERGSNANGDYIRWADGTQVCTGSVSLSFVASDNYVAATAIFPAAFVSTPTVVSGTYQGVSNGSASDASYPPSSTSCVISVSPTRGTTFGSPGTRTYTYLAIGRWK